MIIKREHEVNYTILSNAMLQDETVSFAARGLLSYMLSLPANWIVYEKELQQHTTDGRTAIHTAMSELIQAGYVCKTGARERTRYYVDEYPHTPEDWTRYIGTKDAPVPDVSPSPPAADAEKPVTPNTENLQSQCRNSTKPLPKISITQCRKSALPNAENLQIQSKHKNTHTNVCGSSEPEKLFLKIWQTAPGNIFNSLARLELPADWTAFWKSSSLTCEEVRRVMQNVIDDVNSGALERRYIPKTPDRFVLGGGFTRHQNRYDKSESFIREKTEPVAGNKSSKAWTAFHAQWAQAEKEAGNA
jgi:hypothetical protein